MPTLQSDTINGLSDGMNAFIAGVRLFMRDYEELNRLIDGEESSPRMIAFAVLEAVSEFNSTPPPIRSYTPEEFLQNGWQSFLMKGTIKSLLRSIALLQTRNHLRFSDGGITAQVSDRGPQLMQFSTIFGREWDNWIVKHKISLNIMGALNNNTGAPSEYSLLHGWNYYDDYY